MKRTQLTTVRNHLEEHGSITSYEAINRYGITRLSAVIFLLRKEGLPIYTETVTVKSRYGKTNVAKYRLG